MLVCYKYTRVHSLQPFTYSSKRKEIPHCIMTKQLSYNWYKVTLLSAKRQRIHLRGRCGGQSRTYCGGEKPALALRKAGNAVCLLFRGWGTL